MFEGKFILSKAVRTALILLISTFTLIACGDDDGGGATSDTTSSVITLNGSDPVSLFLNDLYTEAGASAIDNVDGSVSVMIMGTVDTSSVGSYTLTYSAIDAAGNTGTATRTVNVIVADTTAPVITLNGSSLVSIFLNAPYIEAGASAIDKVDGSVSVTITGAVNTSTVGSYALTYSATDAADNTATPTRTVNVIGNDFITTWKTDNPGVSNNDQIWIKTAWRGGGYNYRVDWGDGQIDLNVRGDITHTYATAGTYTILIGGDFPQILSGSTHSDAAKLLSIEQWGDIKWKSMNMAFSACQSLEGNASDAPDLSQVSDMSYMFQDASTFNQDLSNWNVSAVTIMGSMFVGVTLSVANYDALLAGWSAQSLQHNVVFHGGNSVYSHASQANRDTLTEGFGWRVFDGGVDL